MKVLFGRHTAWLWLLGIITALISLKSFTPGTWLSGWDTLHPEFNFGLAFQRLIFGVFRPEQGLGAVAAHSHMADLPRVALMALASLVVPVSFLRYLFISLCLLAGALGSFVFIRGIVLRGVKNNNVFAFLGSLFYFLNLGTLQHFYVPFEMFTVQFAVLPWLFYFASRYLQDQERRDLVLFGVVTVLSAPMAFASALWFVYFISFLLYLLFFIKKQFKKVAVLVVLTLAINLFWLLPAFYFVSSGNASLVQSAKVNKIFSREAFAYNQNYGTVSDILLLKNFLFDWQAYDARSDEFTFLMDGWREHLSKPWIIQTGYFFSMVALAGIFFSFFSGRRTITLALFLPTALAGIFLINQNAPFDRLFNLIREGIPLFAEAMRFPFTKFSLIFIFGLTCFFAIGQRYLHIIFRSISLQLLVFGALFFIYMKPAFEGDFISSKIQVSIPQEYFALFDWFDKEPDGRVAVFPVHSFWNWIYYKWGFQGAQFISFGIKQPHMDRDYDRWNAGNEEYFRQISRAVYSQDLPALEKTLEKYKIRYLILDRNITAPGDDKRVLFNDETESLFSGSKLISPVKKFGEISVYRFNAGDAAPVFAPPVFTGISGSKGVVEQDRVYSNFGDYFEENENPSIIMPFRGLSDNQNIINSGLFRIDDPQAVLPWSGYLQNELSVPAGLYAKSDGKTMTIKIVPQIFRLAGEQDKVNIFFQLPYKDDLLLSPDSSEVISLKDTAKEFTKLGTVFLSTGNFSNMAFYSAEEEITQDEWDMVDVLESSPFKLCGTGKNRQEGTVTIVNSRGVQLSAKNTLGCFRIPLGAVIPNTANVTYKTLLRFNMRIDSSGPGHYCFFDTAAGRCIKEREFVPSGEVSDFIPIDPVSIGRMQLLLFLDAQDTTKKISYNNISFTVNNPVGFYSLSPLDLSEAFKDLNFNINQLNEMIFKEIPNSARDFDLLNHDPEPNSCASVLSGKFTKNIDKAGGFIEYSSQNGSSCDYFAFPYLPHNLGYIITVEAQNITGLTLKMCVANTLTKRCDLSVSLPQKTAPALFLLPPVNDGGIGYNIHIDNYSVGRITSTNRIKGLKIAPFPYYWISGIQIAEDKNNLVQSSGFKISFVKELFPGFIVLKSSNKQGNVLLVLNRSFDKGFFSTTGRHVRVNNWANGWLIDESGEKTIYIFFWPQMLEFAGFIIAGVSFVLLLRRIRF